MVTNKLLGQTPRLRHALIALLWLLAAAVFMGLPPVGLTFLGLTAWQAVRIFRPKRTHRKVQRATPLLPTERAHQP